MKYANIPPLKQGDDLANYHVADDAIASFSTEAFGEDAIVEWNEKVYRIWIPELSDSIFINKYSAKTFMVLFTHHPESPLSSIVRRMWILEEDHPFEVQVHSFPVGYPFINVLSESKFSIEFPRQKLVTSSYLAGSNQVPFQLRMPVVKRALTIQLQPFAIPGLWRTAAADLRDQVVPLADLDDELANRLEELLMLEKQPDIVLRKTATILENRVTDGGIDPRVVGALDHILQNRGQGSISSLAGQVNLSQRRLQQLFRDYFGLSAKSYSRVVRLQHHTYELLTGRSIDTIVPDGYYDQSHFLHDLKRQTGLLPDAYVDVLNDPAHKPAYLSSNLFL